MPRFQNLSVFYEGRHYQLSTGAASPALGSSNDSQSTCMSLSSADAIDGACLSTASAASHSTSVGVGGEAHIHRVVDRNGRALLLRVEHAPFDDSQLSSVNVNANEQGTSYRALAERVGLIVASGMLTYQQGGSSISQAVQLMVPRSGGNCSDHLYAKNTLQRRIRKSIEKKETFELASKAIFALQCLHTVHVFHGDVKPENFMHEEGVFVDYGTAVILEEGVENKTCQDPFGTRAYMSPEINNASSSNPVPLSFPSDVYSLTTMLLYDFELLGPMPLAVLAEENPLEAIKEGT